MAENGDDGSEEMWMRQPLYGNKVDENVDLH